MPRKRSAHPRVYLRGKRYYGDFRGLGGGREPLVPDDQTKATTDRDVAEYLAKARARELELQARRRSGVAVSVTLGPFAADHLVRKARGEKVSVGWLERTETRLARAIKFFGEDRALDTILPSDIEDWIDELRAMKVGRGAEKNTMSAGTIRHHLNALSNLYRRAGRNGHVLTGYNPVSALLEKPSANTEEAGWLEVHEAALLLEAARLYRPVREERTLPFAYPLIATFLLTGAREKEVLGLEVDDVSFRRKTVTFRPNQWRTLKTKKSHRPVPLWPQLEEILKAYTAEREREGGLERLLFPSPRRNGDAERMLTDIRRTLDAVAERGGWAAGEIRTKLFRHTYCAARLQTTDRGAPVSPFTVSRELGHGGFSMVDRVYGHLGTMRHRSERVEYRVKAFEELLAQRLEAVRTPSVHERCRGTTAAGEPCRERGGLSEDGFCVFHDPARREAARRLRKRS